MRHTDYLSMWDATKLKRARESKSSSPVHGIRMPVRLFCCVSRHGIACSGSLCMSRGQCSRRTCKRWEFANAVRLGPSLAMYGGEDWTTKQNVAKTALIEWAGHVAGKQSRKDGVHLEYGRADARLRGVQRARWLDNRAIRGVQFWTEFIGETLCHHR